MSTKTRSASKNQNAKHYIKKAPNNINRENLRSDTKKKRLDFTQSKIDSFDKPKKSKFKGKEEDEELVNNLNNNVSSFEIITETFSTERSLRSRPNPNLEMELENHQVILKNLKPKESEQKTYIKEEGTKTENKLEEISKSDSSIDLIIS